MPPQIKGGRSANLTAWQTPLKVTKKAQKGQQNDGQLSNIYQGILDCQHREFNTLMRTNEIQQKRQNAKITSLQRQVGTAQTAPKLQQSATNRTIDYSQEYSRQKQEKELQMLKSKLVKSEARVK